MFQMPAFVLSVLIASICAALFHIWRGRSLRDLATYWVASVLGFLLGQWAAIALGWNLLVLGQVHLLEGVIVAGAALCVVMVAQRRK